MEKQKKPKLSIKSKWVLAIVSAVVLVIASTVIAIAILGDRGAGDLDSNEAYHDLLGDVGDIVDENPDEALRMIDDAIEHQQVGSEAHILTLGLRVTTLANEGRYDEAIETLRHLISINDERENEDQYMLLSFLYRAIGDREGRYDAIVRAREVAFLTGNNLNLTFYNLVIMETYAARAEEAQ